MLGNLKKRKSDKANIDQQLYNAIYRKITKEKHNYPSPKKGDKTIMECIECFKAEVDSDILSELEKSLTGQEKYQKYYIKNFLPELLQEITQSKELGPEKIKHVLRVTSGIVKRSSEEECKSLLSELEAKITESTKLSSEEKTERKKCL